MTTDEPTRLAHGAPVRQAMKAVKARPQGALLTEIREDLPDTPYGLLMVALFFLKDAGCLEWVNNDRSDCHPRERMRFLYRATNKPVPPFKYYGKKRPEKKKTSGLKDKLLSI